MWISRKEYTELIRANEKLKQVESEYGIVREIFVRLVEQKRTISFSFVDESPDGNIKWDTAQTESGSKEMTVWFETNGEVEIGE